MKRPAISQGTSRHLRSHREARCSVLLDSLIGATLALAGVILPGLAGQRKTGDIALVSPLPHPPAIVKRRSMLTLIAETSCEARNLFLDRALLVETMAPQRS